MFKSALFVGIAVAIALGVVASPAADAAKGGKPRAAAVVASITLNQANPSLGDTVSFSYTLDPTIDDARIQVVCSQNGMVVYGEAMAAAGNSFTLGGAWSPWLMSGGAADCVATLYSWDFHPVQTFVPYASTSFHAGG
jgi:hypothetical protein